MRTVTLLFVTEYIKPHYRFVWPDGGGGRSFAATTCDKQRITRRKPAWRVPLLRQNYFGCASLKRGIYLAFSDGYISASDGVMHNTYRSKVAVVYLLGFFRIRFLPFYFRCSVAFLRACP